MQRAYVFFDGQAIFKQAKACWDYRFPNFDPICLAQYVVSLEPNRELNGFFFYTGVPDAKHNFALRTFWNNKIRAIKTSAANDPSIKAYDTFTSPLKYRVKTVFDKKLQAPVKKPIGREKGIDVRLALDAIHRAYTPEYDVLILMSQDSDLKELIIDVEKLATKQGRTVIFESAYPYARWPHDPERFNRWEMPKTRGRRIYKKEYDACIDPLTSTYWPTVKGALPFTK